jgi:hypothetical protein
MRIVGMIAAGAVALMSFAGSDAALAKSSVGYAHHHGKHKVHRHRRHRHIAVHRPYRGPAFTLWQKRYEEPQWNPYDPYGYGTAYAPD